MKVGILGGGQLGRMLLQAAINYDVETFVLEDDDDCPAAHLCHHFTKGDIKDFDAVYEFGQKLDVLTIEIEAVNIEALEKLEKEGLKIIPTTKALRTIKNKISQKEFFIQNLIPTSDFIVTNDLEDLKNNSNFLPAVHKVAEGGYDGKGVVVLKDESDISKGFNAASVLEKLVHIKKEIAVIVAVNQQKEIAIYPITEMVFDVRLNLLDYQLTPALVSNIIKDKAEIIAKKLVTAFDSAGLFAVEMFVTDDDEVVVNEVAPRVHNSGHHTIEANFSSQFDMLWRILLELPLGNTNSILPSVIVNVVGEENYNGLAIYKGLDEILKMDNAFVHLYGKKQTKPGRKMGHVTLLSDNREELIEKAHEVKTTLKIIS